jgi:hypothetical protein
LSESAQPQWHWHYRVGLALTGLLLLFTLILLPLTVASAVRDVLGLPLGEQFVLSPFPHDAATPTHTDLHIVVVDLNEVRQMATLQVTGHHICAAPCDWSDRVQFFSLLNEPGEEGYPPSVSITLPPSLDAVSQTVELPLLGWPLKYPFDDYRLRLGLVLERVRPDGTVQALPPAEAQGALFVTVQERLAQLGMRPPVRVDPQQVQQAGSPISYVYVAALEFHRLLYVRVLAVLLVVLLAAAAVYAVFLRPFQDLAVNASALIIGLWGIRVVLTPANVTYVTAVDLFLAVVILILLGVSTVRAVLFLYVRSALPRFWNRHPE